MIAAALLTLTLCAPTSRERVLIPEWARELYLTNDLVPVNSRGVLSSAFRVLPARLSFAMLFPEVEAYRDQNGRLGDPVPELFTRYGKKEPDAKAGRTKYLIVGGTGLLVKSYTGDARNVVTAADHFVVDAPGQIHTEFRRNARALRRELGSPMFLSDHGRRGSFGLTYWWSDETMLSMSAEEIDAKTSTLYLSLVTSTSSPLKP